MSTRLNGAQGTWVLMLLLIFSVLLALALGRFSLAPETLLRLLASRVIDLAPSWSEVEAQVLWSIRVPRVALAAIIGAGLALAGAALQSVFRNPLADSQILGVSSGAALGGVVGIIFISPGWPGAWSASGWRSTPSAGMS